MSIFKNFLTALAIAKQMCYNLLVRPLRKQQKHHVKKQQITGGLIKIGWEKGAVMDQVYFDKYLVGNRIKSRRIELRLTLAELADRIGVAASTIQRYETGYIKRAKLPVLKAICEALDLDYASTVGSTEDIRPLPDNIFPADEDIQSSIQIPIIGRVAAGLACHAEQDIEGYEYASADDVKSGHDYVYLRVKGDSMSPLIMEDDLVLVRCQDIVDSGTYAVVIIDDEDGVVKKIFMSKGRIELRSENPYYPPRIFKGEECARVRIFGKVVECKRKF